MTKKLTEKDHLNDVERVLGEVREMLTLTEDTGDINELTALQMLLQVTQAIHSIHNVRDVITVVLDSAIAFAEADRAFLMMMDEEEMPRFKMGRDKNKNYLSLEEFSPSTGVIEKTLRELKTLVVPDAQQDKEFNKRESVQSMSLRTIMCSPLQIKKELIGLLYVDSSHNALTYYSRAHINVLASLADQSAIAIRNAQKFETQA